MASKRKCAVPGCVSEGAGSVSYHRFPTSVERRKLWLEALGLEKPLRQQICSQHFESDSFVSSAVPEAWEGAGYKRRRLHNDAVPVSSACLRTLLDTTDERMRGDIEDDAVVLEHAACNDGNCLEPLPPVLCYQEGTLERNRAKRLWAWSRRRQPTGMFANWCMKCWMCVRKPHHSGKPKGVDHLTVMILHL